eukprot:TRINITY_DN6177_c0_g1_i1.p1 TRINITY_DN6177_c0_g1~~TRINITY_DN6177_c0_g1_i1.p1  ORF type:complete len:362 (-),score=37.79 TRINITY_DN6177_c0_g1_i1:83-1168(-)
MSVQRSGASNPQNPNVNTTTNANSSAGPGPSQRPPSASPGTSPAGTPAGSPALPPRDLDEYNRGAVARRPPYSAYGSRYGGYGGPSPYSRYGGGGYPYQRYQSPNGMGSKMDQGMGSIQYLQSLIDTFARFAELLSMNAEAVHGSFSSVMGLLEIFSHLKREIGVVLSGIALVRWASKHLSGLLGVQRKTRGETARYAEEFSRPAPGFPWSSVGVLILGALALSVMVRALRKFSETFDEDDEEVKEEVTETKALYDFRGQRRGDLPFKKGDTLKILDKSGIWWLGELTSGPNKGLKGEFPGNYVENGLTLEDPPTDPRTTGSLQRSSSYQRLGERRGYSNYPSRYGGYNEYYPNEYPPEIW